MKLLLIEDDDVLADGLEYTLLKNGYNVTVAKTASYAETSLLTDHFDLMILDLGLPDMDGLNLLKKIRAQKLPIPILILTARDTVHDRIEGINMGADDYLSKPFDLQELEARLNALVRRCYGGFSHTIQIGCLELDTRNQQISAHHEHLPLSARENKVLQILMVNAGRVVCKDQIAHYLATANDSVADNAIEVYIHRIRKHIEPFDVHIRTLRGLGYILECKHDDSKKS